MAGAIAPCIPCGSMQHAPPTSTERRIMHYSSLQRILLVGEGDFSFSNSLATAFGDGRNITATSLDSQEQVLKKYADAAVFTLSNLKRLGALLFHEVDATSMAIQGIIRYLVFDCIIYNFPHAGFRGPEDDKKMIKQHKQLVRLFFANAARLLRPNGEVHVSHKIHSPYCKWKLEKQAAKGGLMLKATCDFKQADYPGYVNRRGDGNHSAGTFHLGQCKTFIFKIRSEPSSPWMQLSHILRSRSEDFFHNMLTGCKLQTSPSVIPTSALGLPGKVIGPFLAGLHRSSLKRRLDEEHGYGTIDWEIEELQAAKRGRFLFSHSGERNMQQINLPRLGAVQLDLIHPEKRLMGATLSHLSHLCRGSHLGGTLVANAMRPSANPSAGQLPKFR